MYNKGNAYTNLKKNKKKYKKAIDCFDNVLLLDSKDTDALKNKGASHYNLK